MRRKTTRTVSRGTRGIAWCIAWVLSMLLVLLLAVGMLLRGMTNASLYVGIMQREDVLNREMEMLTERAEALGEEYHFSPDLILKHVTSDALRMWSEEVADWWTNLMKSGLPKELPLWDGEAVREELMNDPTFLEAHDSADLEEIVSDMQERINRAVLPVRAHLILQGILLVRKKVDVTGMLWALQQLPWLLAALSLALVGLLGLLLAREPRWLLRYLGAALGGAVLLGLVLILLIAWVDIPGLTRESSLRLAEEFTLFLRRLGLETGLVLLGMLLLAGGCFAGFFRVRRQQEVG